MVYIFVDDNQQFYNELIQTPISVVKVYSDTCAPCKPYAEKYKQLSNKYPYVPFLDVNMKSNLIRVSAVPTTLIIGCELTPRGPTGYILEKILGGDDKELDEKLKSYFS